MSCLFQSLGHLTRQDPAQLRRAICDYLERNLDMMGDGIKAEDVVGWESARDLGSYVAQMRRSSTWGGATEIKAFTDMTGMVVVVHDLQQQPGHEIRFLPRGMLLTPTEELHISWNGNHYEPMRKRRIRLRS